MSAYDTGVTAYRDAVKWLVGLVPTATVVAGGIALGPELVDAASDVTAAEFLGRYWPSLVGIVLVAAGLWAIVFRTTRLLAVQAPDVSTISDDDRAAAFGAGVGRPYFADVFVYDELHAAFVAWMDAQRPGESGGSTPAQPVGDDVVTALGETADSLRSWALHRELGAEFTQLLRWSAAGIVAMVLGLLVAAVDLGAEPERLDAPVAVEVVVPHSARSDFASVTGCTWTDGPVAGWLVAGDWDEPVLQFDGPGCAPTADWQPPGDVASRPAP